MLRFMPLLVFAVVAVLFALPLIKGKDPFVLPSALIGKPAPEAGLPPRSYDGTPALVNFFASWCLSCAAEQQVLAAVAKEQNIPVYGVDYKDTRAAVTAWLAAYGNPYAFMAIDVTGRAGIDWGVAGVPETFVVDSGGIIRWKYAGPVTEEIYKKELGPLLRELKK